MNNFHLIFRNFNAINRLNPCWCILSSRNYNNKKFRPKNDSGIRKRKQIFNNDPTFASDLQQEDDFDDLESDFGNSDISLNEHARQLRQKRNRMNYEMVKRKFFTPPKSPNMLTWAERRQIAKLHSQDPNTWTIDALAESFPATREIVSKILNNKWQPESFKRMKAKDAKVFENWKLLAEGKLEIDGDLAEHLKRFLPRREEYLASLKTEDFPKLLESEKPKQIWNNGQMSKILESYEKSLQVLEEKRMKQLSVAPNDEQGNLNKLQENLETVVPEPKKDRQDRVLVFGNKENSLNYSKEIGASKSEENYHTSKEETVQKYNIHKEQENCTSSKQSNAAKVEISTSKTTPEASQSNVAKVEMFASKTTPKASQSRIIKALRDLANSSSDQTEDRNSSTMERNYTQTGFSEPNKGILLHSNKNLTRTTASVEPWNDDSKKVENYASEKDREVFEAEERSLKGSSFWNDDSLDSTETPRDLAVIEAKESRQSAAPISKSAYPERISIPRKQRGKGLTFQVDDCFYDDDGEFLYRVPGMKTAAT